MVKLENSVKVFVPVTDNNGVKVDLNAEITDALNVIGGATTYQAQGSWVDGGKLYTDDMKVMQFNAMKLDEDTTQVISELVKAIFTKAEQLAVSVEVNGVLYILESIEDIKNLF